MRGNDVIGILFAYVHEERVRELTQNRVMASVPYGGRYRLVDFPLSNMVNSGINKVGVITEQNYQSLMDHLGSGKAWDLSRKREGLYLLPPFGAETMRTEGKISSLASIMRFLKNSHEEYVLLSDCDTVANIDYKEVFALHTAKEADITIIYRHGTSPDTDKNVVYTVDPEGFIRDMVVKRGSDTDCNFGMGMCLIGRKRLMAMIEECMGRNLYDFDRDLLQRNPARAAGGGLRVYRRSLLHLLLGQLLQGQHGFDGAQGAHPAVRAQPACLHQGPRRHAHPLRPGLCGVQLHCGRRLPD